ncbi:MAG: PrsW family intramembrane metalloprotease [bacterium]|nr:PrsW family intramembrane metalloprotease [bacterium]
MTELTTLIFAVFGGILPALFWLWFWLKEDSVHPEPREKIAASFLVGMGAVFLALPLEHFACSFIVNGSCGSLGGNNTLATSLALIEELVKFLAVYIIAFHSKYFDEPVDALIYLITVALGFSAMENTLYLLNITSSQGIAMGLINGNLRFIGATVLHVASSAVLGIMIAFTFYRHRLERILWALVGVIIAALLHTLFNLSIIKVDNIGQSLRVFSYYWGVIVIIILLFERIKHMRPVVVISPKKS